MVFLSFLVDMHGVKQSQPFPCPSYAHTHLSQFLAAEGRYVYTTPKSYLELLKLFISLLEKKHVEADAAIQRLEGGVLKLAESAEAVANLEDNLKVNRALVLLGTIYTHSRVSIYTSYIL